MVPYITFSQTHLAKMTQRLKVTTMDHLAGPGNSGLALLQGMSGNEVAMLLVSEERFKRPGRSGWALGINGEIS